MGDTTPQKWGRDLSYVSMHHPGSWEYMQELNYFLKKKGAKSYGSDWTEGHSLPSSFGWGEVMKAVFK